MLDFGSGAGVAAAIATSGIVIVGGGTSAALGIAAF